MLTLASSKPPISVSKVDRILSNCNVAAWTSTSAILNNSNNNHIEEEKKKTTSLLIVFGSHPNTFQWKPGYNLALSAKTT